jgi:hypothetical protein
MREYRDHVTRVLGPVIPHVAAAAELIEMARSIPRAPIEEQQGWHTEPPFPGAVEKPQEMSDGWRMVCASRLYKGEEDLGVIFMTLYCGRPAGVFLQGPGNAVPEEYSVLTSR